MARWKLLPPVAVIVGLIAGMVTVSLGSSNEVRPAEAGDDSYALSNLTVSYPFTDPITGDPQEGLAEVNAVAVPTTDRYAGDVRCQIEVFGADGTVVGRSIVWVGSYGTEPIDIGPVRVSVEGEPASAQGFCEKGEPTDASAGYTFSDLRTVLDPNPALVGTISWRNDAQPGEFLCSAVLETSAGREEIPFSLAQSEGEGVIVLLSKDQGSGTPVDVTCEPMVGQPLP